MINREEMVSDFVSENIQKVIGQTGSKEFAEMFLRDLAESMLRKMDEDFKEALVGSGVGEPPWVIGSWD